MKRYLLYLGILILLLELSACCKDCLISRSEISWSNTTKNNGIFSTEIHDGDKCVKVTSNNGGTLNAFSLDDVNIFLPQENDLILKDLQNNKDITATAKIKYASNDKNLIFVESKLSNDLELQKKFYMNLNPGDLFLLRDIINNTTKTKNISLIQSLTVKPGGYLIVPLSMISSYPSRYLIYDSAGKLENHPLLKESKIVSEKLFFSTKNENITLRTDATDGWFGYILNNEMMLVKYSMPTYKKNDKSLCFSVKINNDKIEFNFGEILGRLQANEQIKTMERIALIKLDNNINTLQDATNTINYIKIPLILNR